MLTSEILTSVSYKTLVLGENKKAEGVMILGPIFKIAHVSEW